MERLPLILVALLAIGLVAGGCGNEEAKATQKEEENFRNPSKTPPPEAGNIGGPPPDAGK